MKDLRRGKAIWKQERKGKNRYRRIIQAMSEYTEEWEKIEESRIEGEAMERQC